MGASELPMGDTSDFSQNSNPTSNNTLPMDNGQSNQDITPNNDGMPPVPDNDVNPSGSKIDDIYNQLSDDDKKATEKYAQSLLDRSEENGAAAEVGESPDNAGGMPMQEVYVMREGKLVPGRIGYRRKNRK